MQQYNKDWEPKYEKAEKQFSIGSFEEAFASFETIGNSQEAGVELQSEAFNMLGLILFNAAPHLAQENEIEEGLAFFEKSLELNPENLGTMLNILVNFGDSFGQHQNLEIVGKVLDCLSSKAWDLQDGDLELIESSKADFQSLVNKNHT